MPNSFAVADWVSMDCMRLLTNMLQAASYANFSYQDEFKKDFQPGDTVRVKFPQEFVVTDGFEFSPQTINRQTTTVTIDQPLQIGFEWDSLEKALKLERSQAQIQDEYNVPAMQQFAQEFETRFMDFAFYNIPNVVGVMTAVPTAWSTYASAKTRMLQHAAWSASPRRGMIVSPDMEATLIANSLTQFNPTKDISDQYREGSMGRAAGFEWFASMACHIHTTGIWATVATGVTISGSGQSGTSILVACTTGDTFNRGDTINIAAVNRVNPRTKRSTGVLAQYKIMVTVTGAASAATLTINNPGIIGPGSPYQNVDALPLTAAVVTLMPGTTMVNGAAKTGTFGLAVNPLAIAMAGIELMIPSVGGPVKMAKRSRDKNTGLSIAMVTQWEPLLRREITRIDSLIGFGALYADRAGVLIASLT